MEIRKSFRPFSVVKKLYCINAVVEATSEDMAIFCHLPIYCGTLCTGKLQ